MGGNYEKSIYNQLMEVMGRLEAVEKDLRVEKSEHKEDVDWYYVKKKYKLNVDYLPSLLSTSFLS